MVVKKIYYGRDAFLQDASSLKEMLNEKFDTILAVARGGLSLAHILSEMLEIRNVSSVSAVSYDDTNKKESIEISFFPDLAKSRSVLVVDDICDSGRTLEILMQRLKDKYPKCSFKSAVLFQKPSASYHPDYWVKEAKGWIDFFWCAKRVDKIKDV